VQLRKTAGKNDLDGRLLAEEVLDILRRLAGRERAEAAEARVEHKG
jgi:hypothetical protein